MKLSDFASELVAKNQFVKVSIGGFAGSGKTKTGGEFVSGSYKDLKCTKPVLIIDNEKGSRFLIPFFKQQGIDVLVKETSRLADVLQSMEYLKAGEIDYLFVDSLSKVWYQYVRDYKAKNRVTFMSLQDWGKILPAWQEEFSDRFVELAGNFLFTGRGGFQYEKEEDVTDEQTGKVKKGQFVKSGVKMKMAGETPFEPDLNIWMELQQDVDKSGNLTVWREAQILKDRSGLIDGKVFKNPSYKDFQPFVQFLVAVPVGHVAGETNTENLAPSEDFGRYARKQEREIELEKIKALYDKAALGTSKEEKKLKVIITERVFGTSSGTEIEKMDAEKLGFYRLKLEKLFEKFHNVAPETLVDYVQNFNFEKAMADLPFDQPKKEKP